MFSAHGVEVCRATARARVNRTTVKLDGKEAHLLEGLMKRPGHFVDLITLSVHLYGTGRHVSRVGQCSRSLNQRLSPACPGVQPVRARRDFGLAFFGTSNVVVPQGIYLESEVVRLYPGAWRVMVGESDVELTMVEYRMLKHLMMNKGKVLKLSDIFLHLWEGEDKISEGRVRTHVGNLRSKIERLTSAPVVFTRMGGYFVR